MIVKIPATVEIPSFAALSLPLTLRIRLLFDCVDTDVFLSLADMADSLGLHIISVRRALSELKEDGCIETYKLLPPNNGNPAKAYRIKPLSAGQ